MENLNLLTSLFQNIFIKCLFISILSIIIAGKVLNTDTRNAFVITKVLILVYAGLNIGLYFIAYFSPVEMDSMLERATGSYSFAFYLMLLPKTIFPLLLLFTKLGRNKYLLLALSFLMNISWMLELFIVYRTDLYREHAATHLLFNYLWFIVLQGAFVGAIIYAIGRVIKRTNPDATSY